jgi:CheY-like chemotaxis protein
MYSGSFEMPQKQALIVEDNPANRLFFERLLMQAGFEILSAASGREAQEKVAKATCLELAVMDMEIPDTSGLEMTKWMRRLYPDACLVVATMHDERSLMQSAFERGCDVFLVKPHGFMDLYKRLATEGAASLHAERPLVIDQYGQRRFEFIASTL